MNDYQKLTLWLGAFRYYCGRMTYAVSDFCELLVAEWPNLPAETRNLIQSDLEREFKRDNLVRGENNSYPPLGADCDLAEWEKVRALWRK